MNELDTEIWKFMQQTDKPTRPLSNIDVGLALRAAGINIPPRPAASSASARQQVANDRPTGSGTAVERELKTLNKKIDKIEKDLEKDLKKQSSFRKRVLDLIASVQPKKKRRKLNRK